MADETFEDMILQIDALMEERWILNEKLDDAYHALQIAKQRIDELEAEVENLKPAPRKPYGESVIYIGRADDKIKPMFKDEKMQSWIAAADLPTFNIWLQQCIDEIGIGVNDGQG